MRFCDYCGNELTGRTEAVGVGHSEHDFRRCGADRWFYYCEGDCTNAVTSILDGLARWANHGEGSGLEWRLVEAPGVREAREPRRQSVATEPIIETPPEVRGDSDLRDIGLHHQARAALSEAGIRTLEEAAQYPEIELLAVKGVGRATIRKLVKSMKGAGLTLPEGAAVEVLGARIRQLREQAGVTRDELVEAIDDGYMREMPNGRHTWFRHIYASNIAEWENGSRVPNRDWLHRMARYFGVIVQDLTKPESTNAAGTDGNGVQPGR